MSWYDGLLDVAQGVATAALASTGPLGMAAAAAINEYLDDDDKVDANTTVEEYQGKFDKLSPDQQEKVANAYYNFKSVEVKFKEQTKQTAIKGQTQEALSREVSDRQKGAVRPKVVLLCTYSLLIVTTVIAFAMAFGEKVEWEPILAIMGTQTYVIREYMKRRSQDKVTAVHADQGLKIEPERGLIQTILGR